MTNPFSYRLSSVLVLFTLLTTQTLFASDYYWIGGSGNWSDPSHWSLTSGGSSAGSVPGSSDKVIFDDNSFSYIYSQVDIGVNVQVKDFVVNTDHFPVFSSDDVNIKITNSLDLQKKAHFALGGKLIFDAIDSDWHTINTATVDFASDVQFNGGKWELQNHLKTIYDYSISFNSGEFKTNNYSVASGNLYANSSVVKFDLGTSLVLAKNDFIMTKAINYGGTEAWLSYNSLGGTVEVSAFSGSKMMDDSVDCALGAGGAGGAHFVGLITSDYNGSSISCQDSCDGEITLTITGGTGGPYSVSYTPPLGAPGPFESVFVYPDLCGSAIPHGFVLKDSSCEQGFVGSGVYCECSLPIVVSAPTAVQLGTDLHIPNSCPDSCDAQGFITTNFGTEPITAFWPVSGETTLNPVGLCEGWNIVELTDVNGCPTVIDSIEINGPPPIIPDITVTPPSCNGDCDAEVDANPSGGNGGTPWTILWSPAPTSGAGSDPGIGFCAGVVTLTVFDDSLCPKDTTFTIIDPPVLSVTVGPTSDVICNGECNGSATANGAGGTGGFTYEWFDAATDVSVGAGDVISTLCAGDYYVIVTDASGCTAQSPDFTISEPPPLVLNQDAYQVSCPGLCDGAVDVDVSGGTPPYMFSWTTFPGLVGVGASDSISGLCAGFYQITVTDDNGCDSTMVEIEVIEPTAITAAVTLNHPTCYDLCDGSIIVTPAGGSPGYGFTWSPVPPVGGATGTPSSMCDGSYDLTITDIEGCTLDTTLVLDPVPVYDVTETVVDITCFGGAGGTIDLVVNSGGDGGPYTYTWVPAPPVGDGTPNISGLTAGVYCVTIADGLGCDTTICYTVTGPPLLTVTANLISDVTCNGDCDGSADVTIVGGTAPYTIAWTPTGGSGIVASGLCADTYTVTVTDDNGCIESDVVTISEPPPFDLTVAQTDNVCAGECLATATVNMISGGTPPYDYLWSDPLAQTTPTAINLCAGVWTCTVTDQSGCDTVLTFTILEPPAITIDTNLIAPACFGSCDGELWIDVAGGTPGYTFEWFDAATALPLGVDNDSIAGLCPGDYYAQVTDGNGCVMLSDTMTVTELPEILTSIVTQTDATCGVCDGTAEVLATGGAGGFFYDWTPDPATGDGTTTVTGLCDGVYSINITDAAGCTALMSVTVNSLATEVLDLDSVDVSCFGLTDGEIDIDWAPSADAPYTIEVFFESSGLNAAGPFGGIGAPPFNVNGLGANTYIVVLTNATGCVTSDTITINEPPEITGSVAGVDIDCNGACDGSATVTSAGGTGAHTYTWIPMPGGGQGTANAVGLCAGLWEVEVEDANGCVDTFAVIINEPPAISIDLETSTDISCFGANDGTATVSVTGGTPPLNYNWIDCATGFDLVPPQTTPTATGLGPGSYQCEITDDNGCTVMSACLPVNEPTEITAIINQSDVSCFGLCDGMIDAIVSGGVGPYFYQWEDAGMVAIPGQTDDTIQNICEGTYFLTVTDQNGCSQQFGPFDILQPAAWDITESQTNITCSGSCDGIASVLVNAGNNPPYTFLWDDPLTQTTSTATNLCAGVWNVTISDAGTCDTTVTFTIVDNNPMITNFVETPILCNGDCTGEIDLSGMTGGTPPYTITWSDLQVGPTAVGLCAGSITAFITDAAGCTKDTTFDITEPDALASLSTFSNPSTCGLCDGSATVNMTGGTAPYIYDWTPDPAAGEGTPMASGLCPGVITCDVTDANGCTYTEVFTISDLTAEVLTMDSVDVSCFGLCDGEASVTYVCSDPPCTNQWYDSGGGLMAGETGLSITGQCAGTYYVEVTNGSGCVSTDSIVITGPTQILANEVITPISCNGSADGAIDLFPSGGSGAGYTFVWTPAPPVGDGTANVSGLTAGTWSVDITDGDGCTESYNFDLLEPPAITITPTASDVSCNGLCDGIISVLVSGGGGGFTYQWLDGGGSPIVGETGPVITGLCPGNYSVDVTDANGCTVNSGILTISEPVAITGPVVGTDITCFGDCDGTVTVTPGGGIPPYTIQWYDSGGLIGATSTTVTDLCPEDYYAVIQDANGCNFTTAVVTIAEPAELSATTASTDATCNGVCDGTADVFPLGGTLPYTYEWLDVGGGAVVGGTLPNVVNLCADNYTIEVTDANGCTTGLLPVVINEDPAITADVFTNDANCGFADGSATVFPVGGNPAYSYQWFDDTMTPIGGATSNVLSGVFAGTYFVEVTDMNGCIETFIANISNFNNTTLTWDAVNHPTCAGDSDGSLAVTITGDNPPFTVSWDPGGLVAEDPTGLSAGTYTIEIVDALGCINYYDTTLVDPNPIDITLLGVTGEDCGQCNGMIDIFATGGTGTLTEVWNNGDTGPSIINLCAGIYEVVVTDDNGCSSNLPVEVTNSSGLSADDVLTGISCFDACDGAITVNGTGGTPPYDYLWLHNGSTANSLSGLCAGTYFCQVTDAVGCQFTIMSELTNPNEIIVTTNVSNPTCGATDGIITLSTSGGILPHTYLWSPGGETTPTVTGLGAGLYVVTVTDNGGCSQDFPFGLSNLTAPTAELTGTDVNCNGDCDGSLDTLSQTGGTPAFGYQWYDSGGSAVAGETNPAYTGVCAGEYILEITDGAGCISYQSYTIEEPDSISLNPLVLMDPSCNGDCDGQIVSNPFGGTFPFTFLWDDTGAQTTDIATGLCDGTYTVVITDANGCTATQMGTIVEPSPIVITVDSTVAATCVNSADGEIYVTVTGGTAPYTYEYVSITGTDTLTTEDPSGLLPMDWILTVTDSAGCTEIDTIAVDTALAVLAYAGVDTLICFGDTMYFNGSTNIPGDVVDYTWFDTTGTILSDTNAWSIPGNPAGTSVYVLQVDYNGCTHTDTIVVTIGDSIYVEAGPDIELYPQQSGLIGGSPTSSFDGDTITWTPPIYLDDPSLENPNVIKPQESTWYYVTMVDSNGCRAIDSMWVEVLPDIIIPDGISPNGDGLNETWILEFLDNYPGVSVDITVYNRWGETLYSTDETYEDDWDGRAKNGERLPAGTYYYVIDIDHEDFPDPFTGPITIMW